MAKTKKKNKKSKFIVILIVAIGAVVIVGGAIYRLRPFRYFGKFPDKQIGEEKEIVVEDRGEEIEVKETKSLPENFPKDFPIYPNAKIESAFTTKGEEIEAQSVVWVVEESFDNVSSFYRTNLEKNGWNISATFEDEESVTFSIEKGKTNGFVGIGRQERNVIISVTIGARFEEPSI